MCPIKNLSERRRLPRLGKIATGIKTKNKDGVEHPKAVDYFVCPLEVQKVFGEKPKELRIMFPVEDTGVFASQFYRCYSKSRGLVCKGDGESAMMLVDTETGTLADHSSKTTELREWECEGKGCPYYGKQCREVMCLQFLLPDVPGLGVYQIDTGSVNSMLNINSAVALIQNALGKVSMVPLRLVLEDHEVSPDGKKKTVHVLNLRLDVKLSDIMKQGLALPSPAQEVALPVPDDEVPELPENQEKEKPKGNGKRCLPTTSMKTIGDLLQNSNALYGLSKEQVLKELNVTDVMQIADIPEAWGIINATYEYKEPVK